MTIQARRLLVPTLFLFLAGSVGGCRREEGLTTEEAAQAKEELQIGSTSQALTTQTVEIGTHFTIGGAVEKAAGELRDFIQSQKSCADVQLAGHTLTIVYGAHGDCPFNSHQKITGTHEITVSKNDDSEVVVDHVWTDLSNGDVTVSGTAHVTWNLADPSRHVQHDLKWSRTDGRTGEGTGDRVQKPLNGDLAVGFTEDGERTWDGARGHWDLAIAGLQMRWEDPIPQAGTLTLDTPFNKTVSVAFARKDATTIHMTFEGPRGSIGFDVHKL
jgi:hypothetical protein